MACAYNSNTWEVVTEGPEVQGRRQLHSEFKASMDYIRPCFKKTETRASKSAHQVKVPAAKLSVDLWDLRSGRRSQLQQVILCPPLCSGS